MANTIVVIVIIIVIIIILAVAALVVYFKVIADQSGTVGAACNPDSSPPQNCDKFLFCSGDTTCQLGDGRQQGESCDKTSDCVFGNVCVSKVCSGASGNS